MQQEVDTLQNERRDLKEKLRFTTKKNLIDTILNKPLSESNTSGDTSNSGKFSTNNNNNNTVGSDYKEQEVKLNKYLNRILLKNNAELKHYLTTKLLTDLPPLPNVYAEEKFIRNDDENKKMNSLISKSNNLMKVSF